MKGESLVLSRETMDNAQTIDQNICVLKKKLRLLIELLQTGLGQTSS